eukprot:3508982-Amphidinium_carterae.1
MASQFIDSGPEEPEHAFVLWLEDSMASGAFSSDDVRKLLLTVPMRFKFLPTEEARMFQQINTREIAVATFVALSASATQRIFQLAQWKERRLRAVGATGVTNVKLLQMWKDNVQMSNASEPVTDTFLTNAFRLWESIFKIEDCKKLILDAEAMWGRESPFDKISSIDAVASRCRANEDKIWCMEFMIYVVEKKQMSAGA